MTQWWAVSLGVVMLALVMWQCSVSERYHRISSM